MDPQVTIYCKPAVRGVVRTDLLKSIKIHKDTLFFFIFSEGIGIFAHFDISEINSSFRGRCHTLERMLLTPGGQRESER